jgi:hypothetical protein
MKRAGLLVVGVVALIGVALLAGTQGYVQGAEDDSKPTCLEATLHGTYLFAYDGVGIKDDEHIPFAVAGYEVFDGKGKVKAVSSSSTGGEISSNDTTSGTYTVNEDCTGTTSYEDGTHYDHFIAPDGSLFTFVQTDPGVVAAGFEPQGTAKRVGD